MMQTDVRASKSLTATGNFLDYASNPLTRVRIKGIYVMAGASAGTLAINDGGSTGISILSCDIPTAANCGYVYMMLPGEGIVCKGTPYGTLTNVTSVVLYYG